MHQLCSQYIVPLSYEVIGHLSGFRVRYCRYQVSRLASCPAASYCAHLARFTFAKYMANEQGGSRTHAGLVEAGMASPSTCLTTHPITSRMQREQAG